MSGKRGVAFGAWFFFWGAAMRGFLLFGVGICVLFPHPHGMGILFGGLERG